MLINLIITCLVYRREKNIILCVSAYMVNSVSGHTSLNSADSEQTWHDTCICVPFYSLNSKSLIIDKYAFYWFLETVLSLD